MELISYLLNLVITFSGLLVGIILAYIAPEELKPGEKYHLLLQNFIFSAIIAVYVNHALSSIVFGAVTYVLVMFLLSYRRISSRAAYLFSGIILAFSTEFKQLMLIESILIFFYGFPTGTLFVKKMIKKSKHYVFGRLLQNYAFYFLLPLLIYFIELFF